MIEPGSDSLSTYRLDYFDYETVMGDDLRLVDMISMMDIEPEETVKMDAPALIVNGRVMVPLRMFENLGMGYEVVWEEDTKTVLIIYRMS